jgi:hypothetical protein
MTRILLLSRSLEKLNLEKQFDIVAIVSKRMDYGQASVIQLELQDYYAIKKIV